MFDDPTEEERTLYVQYWQDKLKSNNSIAFPDDLVKAVASGTAGFSFAYLKEALYVPRCHPSPVAEQTYSHSARPPRSVSSLVLMAGFDDDKKPAFRDVLLGQIKKLREQLDKGKDAPLVPPRATPLDAAAPAQPHGGPRMQIDERSVGQTRIWDAAPGPVGRMPGALPLPAGPGLGQQPGLTAARARTMAGNVVHALGKSFIS